MFKVIYVAYIKRVSQFIYAYIYIYIYTSVCFNISLASKFYLHSRTFLEQLQKSLNDMSVTSSCDNTLWP
jgi:hypothetical protein